MDIQERNDSTSKFLTFNCILYKNVNQQYKNQAPVNKNMIPVWVNWIRKASNDNKLHNSDMIYRNL